MGSRIWKVALVAAAVVAVSACAPLPAPLPPIRVNTTADTFDGVCDEADCSLQDAIHESNTRAPHPNNLPNEIRIPAGTYTISGDTPIAITRAVVINGASRATVQIDLTGSSIAAPGAALDPRAPVVLTGVTVVSSTETPTHVLASCAGHAPFSFSLMNSRTINLAATSAACDAVFVGVDVIGPATVIAPRDLSVVGSHVPFSEDTLVANRFSFVNSVVTGPSTGDAESSSSADSTLTIHPPEGLSIVGTFTGTHFERVGLRVGNPAGGNVWTTINSSSFDLAGDDGPRAIEVVAGSTLDMRQSTVYGGGADGAVLANGLTLIQGSTIASDGPGIVPGDGASVTARRSILTSLDGSPACTAPITLTALNFLVDSSCGTPSATDTVLGSHAELLLGPVTTEGSRTPTFGMIPDPASPVVDVIAREWTGGLDCPYDAAQKTGVSMDQRGFARPSGERCDVGAIEYQHPKVTVPVETTTTTTEPAP